MNLKQKVIVSGKNKPISVIRQLGAVSILEVRLGKESDASTIHVLRNQYLFGADSSLEACKSN